METSGFREIFTCIRHLLQPYSRQMQVKADNEGQYQLYIVKDIVLAGRSFKECYFSGTVIHTSMVSFYFFPMYTHPDQFIIPAAIQKNLKGKNCFNFKKLDNAQEKAIAGLLKEGAAFYKKIHLL